MIITPDNYELIWIRLNLKIEYEESGRQRVPPSVGICLFVIPLVLLVDLCLVLCGFVRQWIVDLTQIQSLLSFLMQLQIKFGDTKAKPCLRTIELLIPCLLEHLACILP